MRHQGWSISLFSPNGGLAFIENLGLLPELSAISFTPCFRALDGETGFFTYFAMIILHKLIHNRKNTSLQIWK